MSRPCHGIPTVRKMTSSCRGGHFCGSLALLRHEDVGTERNGKDESKTKEKNEETDERRAFAADGALDAGQRAGRRTRTGSYFDTDNAHGG